MKNRQLDLHAHKLPVRSQGDIGIHLKSIRRFLLLFLLGCILTITGCGESHEKVAQDSLAQMKKLATILEGIESVEDAEAARTDLKKTSQGLKDALTRVRRLRTPTSSQDDNLKGRFETERQELADRISKAFDSLSPECKQVLSGEPGTE